VESCPTGAITAAPTAIATAVDLSIDTSIDLGLCIFCPECSRACPRGLIRFTNDVGLGATDAASMIITATQKSPVITPPSEITRLFSRSLKLRSVSAGGCNGCELELNALSNVNFDMGRFGISFVASPRHADGVVVTGPVTQNMAFALEETIRAVPEPRLLILVGTCAISGGLFKNSPAIDRSFLTRHTPDLYIPGCPVHPLAALQAILKFLGR
jgi:Ni,Fe-hydrogenase III small subunit/NAD-dependent dihydropyrimidine dehydrogenase PreA subunit